MFGHVKNRRMGGNKVRQRVEQRWAGYSRHRHRHRHGNIISIIELKPSQEGTIAFVRGNRKIAQRLADLGLTPETSVRMLKTAPLNGPIEIAVRGSKLAIGREIAENILVHVGED